MQEYVPELAGFSWVVIKRGLKSLSLASSNLFHTYFPVTARGTEKIYSATLSEGIPDLRPGAISRARPGSHGIKGHTGRRNQSGSDIYSHSIGTGSASGVKVQKRSACDSTGSYRIIWLTWDELDIRSDIDFDQGSLSGSIPMYPVNVLLVAVRTHKFPLLRLISDESLCWLDIFCRLYSAGSRKWSRTARSWRAIYSILWQAWSHWVLKFLASRDWRLLSWIKRDNPSEFKGHCFVVCRVMWLLLCFVYACKIEYPRFSFDLF